MPLSLISWFAMPITAWPTPDVMRLAALVARPRGGNATLATLIAMLRMLPPPKTLLSALDMEDLRRGEVRAFRCPDGLEGSIQFRGGGTAKPHLLWRCH